MISYSRVPHSRRLFKLYCLSFPLSLHLSNIISVIRSSFFQNKAGWRACLALLSGTHSARLFLLRGLLWWRSVNRLRTRMRLPKEGAFDIVTQILSCLTYTNAIPRRWWILRGQKSRGWTDGQAKIHFKITTPEWRAARPAARLVAPWN